MAGNLLTAIKKHTVRITAIMLILSITFTLCSCNGDNNDFDGKRFSKTRKITVLADPVNNADTDCDVNSSDAARYIHDNVFKECNIDVTFIDSDKLDLRNGISADISFTKEYNELVSYYRMGAVVNLSPYLDNYSYALTDLTELLGDDYIHFCNDDPNEVWCLKAQDDRPLSMVTFIRSDWLEKLGLEKPSDQDEFYNCLITFRDNADLLLGDDASEMIPFFVDSEPNISAKPLLDSYLDTSISDKAFFVDGYCRISQDGYSEGLKTLNKWYLENLLPDDFRSIRPMTKESYEPIEKGYVGSFCSQFDYLYINGENSHINALQNNCGDNADYIAVNTFPDRYGKYASWQEDCISEDNINIFLPATCSDPLACLVYLNWISNSVNIDGLQDLSFDDPFTYDRYLLTGREKVLRSRMIDDEDYEAARQTALEVDFIHRGNLCVRYGPDVFQSYKTDKDYSLVYYDSAKLFLGNVIGAGEGEFETVLSEQYEIYKNSGAGFIQLVRDNEWEKVMVKGSRKPN